MKKKIKSEYEQMLKSGMFYEFFPEYSGNWDKDKSQFTKFYKKRAKIRMRDIETALEGKIG